MVGHTMDGVWPVAYHACHSGSSALRCCSQNTVAVHWLSCHIPVTSPHEQSVGSCWRCHGCVNIGGYLSGVPDYFDRNKILSGYDLSHYQVPHCIKSFLLFCLICVYSSQFSILF